MQALATAVAKNIVFSLLEVQCQKTPEDRVAGGIEFAFRFRIKPDGINPRVTCRPRNKVMAKRKRNQSSSIFSALLVEALALVAFLVLFTQARAERREESDRDNSGFPVMQEMFEQTPFRNLVAQNRVQSPPTRTIWNAPTFFGRE